MSTPRSTVCAEFGCERKRQKRSRYCDEHRRILSKRRPSRAKRVVYHALSPAEWRQLWRYQEGRCAGCRKELRDRYDASTTGAIGAVDHCHRTEKNLVAEGVDPAAALRRSVRGLLCYHCNRNIIGVALKDDAAKARRIADYLDDPPARRVIDLNAEPCNRGTGMLR